jgi:ATP-dependent Clp protease ATP-binding subunit ClpC
MFERFTDRARRVVVLAQEEARLLNHNYIGTEHILLGLIHEGEGVAAKALESLGISLEAVRNQVEEIIGQGGSSPSGHIPFTPRAKKVLELSLREALQLGHNYIGTEHILLGLIREGEGVAAQVLVKLGADLSRVRQQVIQLLSGYSGSGSGGEGGASGGSGEKAGATAGGSGGDSQSGSLVLDQFGRNLTQAAREKSLDPVIGRSRETERVMQILSRRTKNNPVLVGEPGVGKTAIVEGSPRRSPTTRCPRPSTTSSSTRSTSAPSSPVRATAAISRSASRRCSRRSRPAATSSSSSTRSTPSSGRVPPRARSTLRRF